MASEMMALQPWLSRTRREPWYMGHMRTAYLVCTRGGRGGACWWEDTADMSVVRRLLLRPGCLKVDTVERPSPGTSRMATYYFPGQQVETCWRGCSLKPEGPWRDSRLCQMHARSHHVMA